MEINSRLLQSSSTNKPLRLPTEIRFSTNGTIFVDMQSIFLTFIAKDPFYIFMALISRAMKIIMSWKK